jgi:hypothetical protein
MLDAKALFQSSMRSAEDLTGLYDYLLKTHSVPFPFDDLLRAQVMYVLSAFDKLAHDLIRIGMVQTYLGKRPSTEKFRMETITIELHSDIISASIPPAELLFEAAISRKLGFLSFQDPDKLADGLSLIWPEKHKWRTIADKIGMPVNEARTTLKLISMRRNAIVHESDIDLFSNSKRAITSADCADITGFIGVCGNAIVDLVL